MVLNWIGLARDHWISTDQYGGWQRIAEKAPELPAIRGLAVNGFAWALGCAFVHATLFGIGKMIFGEPQALLPLLLIAAISACLIFCRLSRQGWQPLSGAHEVNISMTYKLCGINLYQQ